MAILGCDSTKSDGSQDAEPRPLVEVCEEFCPEYYACHNDNTPVEVCVETCVNDGTLDNDPACEAAVSRWYECRLANLCDGDSCSEEELDTLCSDG